MTRRLLPCLLLIGLFPAAAAGTQFADVVASAREAASNGRREEALAALEAHLADVPGDVDARLLYGLILSWERRYPEARLELRRVLDQAPDYEDARVALMNVALWSGGTEEARVAADAILARDPGNHHAREVRDRLDAATRPWRVGFTYANDSFTDDREVWHELAVWLVRRTGRGDILLRAAEARRFGLEDRQVEVELYPRLRPGTYAFVGVGAAPGSTLYPAYRIAFDLYQSVGAGLEVSGGFRRLGFDAPTNVYVGAVSQYVGNWMFAGKVFYIPGAGLDATSYHTGFRRYLGDGVSFVGLTYGHGFNREEIRNAADLTTLGSDAVRAEIDRQFGGRFRALAAVGTSRQAQPVGEHLWQTTLSGGFGVLF